MSAALLMLCAIASAKAAPMEQDPWPLERQDRYGSGCAVIGPDPASLTTPWISNRLAYGFPVSHGPSIAADGTGYFGDWVDNQVFKFDTATGTILGAFQTPHFVTGVPAIAHFPMVVASTDGKVFGIDSTNMDFDWFTNTAYTGGSPNIGPEGDVAYGVSAGIVYRQNVFSGTTIWSHPGYAPISSTTVFTRDDSKIVFSQGNNVTALKWSDGSTAWSVDLGSFMHRPAVAPNGTIVIGSGSGTVYGLSPVDGELLWFFTTLGEVKGAPALSPDGTVAYVPSTDFRVYALRVSDGTRLWSYSTGASCEVAPSVGTDGRIYVQNKNGDVSCISPAGTKVWSAHLNGEARGPMTIGPDGTIYAGYNGTLMGLAVIRQHAISLDADALAMERGKVLSGGLVDTLFSDDQYVVFGKTLVQNSAERPIRAVFSFHTPVKPLESFKLNVEAKASTPGLTRWTEVWSTTTNTWDQVSAQPESTSDSVANLTVTGASPYADSNGLVKIRVSWKETGVVQGSNWTTSLDRIHLDVVPKFVP